MNQKQNNHLSSYLAIEIVLKKYEEHISTLPAAVSTVAKFSELLEEINKMRQIQDGHTTGTAKQKQKEEAEMIEATVRVAAALFVYAIEKQDFSLQEKVRVAPAYLKKLGDHALLNQCTLIYNIAEGIDGADIAPYGVLAETVVGLKKEIDDFATLVAKPRSEIITRSRATTRLAELFKECNELLRNQLDKLMLVMQLNNPVFYNEYVLLLPSPC